MGWQRVAHLHKKRSIAIHMAVTFKVASVACETTTLPPYDVIDGVQQPEILFWLRNPIVLNFIPYCP